MDSVISLKTLPEGMIMAVMVNPDWEEQARLVFGINQVAVNSEITKPLKQFENEPLLRSVVKAIQGINNGLGLCEQKRAQHQAALHDRKQKAMVCGRWNSNESHHAERMCNSGEGSGAGEA